MNNIAILCLYCIVFVGISCTTPGGDRKSSSEGDEFSKLTELFDSAKMKHDQIMPMLDSIFQSRSLINNEIERAIEGIKEVGDERRRALDAVRGELDSAQEYMMRWMREYGRMPDDSVDRAEIELRLKMGLEEIEKVREKISQSLKNAKDLIKE